jgi:hypothetical protein
MLRLRKKPPTGLPAINSGSPWSPADLAELDELLAEGMSAKDIAAYLCRTVDEVERQIAAPIWL